MPAIKDIRDFLFGNDEGQDLAEYCLLTALIVLIGFAIFLQISGGTKNIWSSMNAQLSVGNVVAGGGSAGAGITAH